MGVFGVSFPDAKMPRHSLNSCAIIKGYRVYTCNAFVVRRSFLQTRTRRTQNGGKDEGGEKNSENAGKKMEIQERKGKYRKEYINAGKKK